MPRFPVPIGSFQDVGGGVGPKGRTQLPFSFKRAVFSEHLPARYETPSRPSGLSSLVRVWG